MYLTIFASPVILTAVAAGAAAALIYEYYAFKQGESFLNHSALESENLERNSVNRTDLRRRKHRIDANRYSSSHDRTERESVENSDLNVLEVAQHSARDVKLLDDVIRNSEYNEKHYEKNVFNKVKNDLTKLNQNFEEKIISEKNIYHSSCVNCEYKATETLNTSVKSKPLVIKVGQISQNHSNCEEDTFYDALDYLNDTAACSKGYDEYEINQIGIARTNCSDRISENCNQTSKNIIDNDSETESFISIEKDVYQNNSNYLFHSSYANGFKNDGVHQYNCQEMNCKGPNLEETKVNSNSICENLFLPSTVKNKLLADRNNSVKHKFNNIKRIVAVIDCDDDTLNSQFRKQKKSIKFQNQAQEIKLLNIDSSYECSPCAVSKDHAYYNGLQSPSLTSPTVGLNEHIFPSSLQPSIDLKENTYDSSLQPSFSNACNKETHTKVIDRYKLYNQYKKRIVLKNKGATKMLNDDDSTTECASSEKAIKNTLNFASHPQLSFNTVSNIETPKYIAQMKFHDQSKKNLGGDQHPTLSAIEDPKNTIYLRTAEHSSCVSGKEKSNGIIDYQMANKSEILSVHANPTFVSHLRHKFMPGLQSYVSRIRKFVKGHEVLFSETNNSNIANAASSSIVNDTKIIKAEDVDIGCQIGLVCDTETRDLNSYTVKPQQILCKGCMEVLANTISVPCGHSYFCMQCAEITYKIYNKCCICLNHVTSFEPMIV